LQATEATYFAQKSTLMQNIHENIELYRRLKLST